MAKMIFILATSAALAGCGVPDLVHTSPYAVTFQYDGTFASFNDAQALAEEECYRYRAKGAMLERERYNPAVGLMTATFMCVR